jgi:two-component system, LytTR family, response regulator LytT
MAKKINILVVEDEFIISDYIQGCLTNLGYNVVGIYTNYDEAIAALNNLKPDIALIDISIKGEKNGIDIGGYIRQHSNIPFVFASSHGDKSTIDLAKETKPYAYLIKPFTEDDLYAVIETALANYGNQNIKEEQEEELIIINDGIFIKHKNKFVKIVLEELMYAEASGNYVNLFTATTHFTLKTTLLKLLEILPPFFIRTQKSYIVNLHHLKSFDTEEVVVHNKTLPIGKSYYDDFFEKLKIVKG